MFFGYMAMIYSIKGSYEFAAYAIVAAAVFDLLDGRVARLTHTESEFGAQYDSLSDVISFGVAPGILLYEWALKPFGRMGWIASFAFAACGALRLARFNVQKSEERFHFQGLPIPMAAGIVASAVLYFNELRLDAWKSPALLAMSMLLAGCMVSTFRYRSFKDLDFRRKQPFFYLVLGVSLITVVALRPEITLFLLFLSYATLGAVFGILRFNKKLINKAHSHNDELQPPDFELDENTQNKELEKYEQPK